MTLRATWNGTVLAESDDIVSVEGNAYFPPESLRREHFRRSRAHSLCPWKGIASYYDIVVDPFGLAFSVVASRLRTNGSLALAGALFRVGLYLVNFKIFAPAVFHVFEDANQPFEFVTHVVFGVVLSLAFFSSGTRRGEPVVAIGDLESARR
jgi:hypothetical protein